MKKISKIIIVEVIGLFFILAFGAVYLADQNGNTSHTQAPAAQTAPVKQYPITITESCLSTDGYGLVHFSGTVVANEDMSYTELDAQFYDSTGAVVNSGIDNVANLMHGQTWKFDITCYDSSNTIARAEVTHYKSW